MQTINAAIVVVALLAEVMAETMAETRTAVIRNLLVSAWILTMDSRTSMEVGVMVISLTTIVVHRLTEILDSIACQCAASAEEDPPPEK